MAQTGTGYRTVNSLVCEMSILHLCQPIYSQPLSSPIIAGLSVTVTVPSTLNLHGQPSPAPSLTYLGAMLVAMDGANTEIVTVLSVTDATHFVADFLFSHAAGIILTSATFPSQSLTDPLLTQTEVLGYIARAQNEFLAECPCIQSLFTQTVNAGSVYQPVTSAAIEMNRVVASALSISVDTLTRISNTVTAATITPHGLIIGQKFSILSVTLSGDLSFVGAFIVTDTPTLLTWTYTQYAPDALQFGATAGLWVRAYEVSQTELSSQDPQWRSNPATSIKSWYEDRTGLYQWGVGGVPATSFPVELLCAIRDTDTLLLTDSFLVPDICLHFVKYKALEYIWSKDGEIHDTAKATYAKSRFDRGVMTMRRWMDWAGVRGSMTAQDTMSPARSK